MKKNLVLVGMMGSGKSTISRLLSDITNQNLIDTDKLIERETRLKISEIFQRKGKKVTKSDFCSIDNIEGLNKAILSTIKSDLKKICKELDCIVSECLKT